MSREIKSAAIVGACFLVLALVALYFVNQTKTKKEKVEDDNKALESQIATLEKKADKLDELNTELELINTNLAEYIQILPSPEVATVERLMELVQEKATRSQFDATQFVLKDSDPRRKKRRRGRRGGGSASAFQEIDITMQAEATFDEFLKFLNSLERHETFLRLNSFSCRAGQARTEGEEVELPLRITLNLSTFRYTAPTASKGGGKKKRRRR